MIKKNVKYGVKWVSTIGRVTKVCSSKWGDGTPHPQYDAPCHYEMMPTYRQWVCHCREKICKFVDRQEVKGYKYRINNSKNVTDDN